MRWLARHARGLWSSNNLLRRASDRVEGAVVAGLLVAFVVGAPLAALLAGRAMYAAESCAVRVEQATRRQVPAVLLADAPAPARHQEKVWTPAQWTAPDGRSCTGEIGAVAGAVAGTTVRVWVDMSGRPTGPPPRQSQVIGQARLAAALAAMGVGLVLLGAGKLVHCALDRRRLAAWDIEWRARGVP